MTLNAQDGETLSARNTVTLSGVEVLFCPVQYYAVDRRVWKRALHDTNIPCRSGFYTQRNSDIPKNNS